MDAGLFELSVQPGTERRSIARPVVTVVEREGRRPVVAERRDRLIEGLELIEIEPEVETPYEKRCFTVRSAVCTTLPE